MWLLFCRCEDEVAGYVCLCYPGYEGDNCEVNINECSSNPCLNSADCNDQVNIEDSMKTGPLVPIVLKTMAPFH